MINFNKIGCFLKKIYTAMFLLLCNKPPPKLGNFNTSVILFVHDSVGWLGLSWVVLAVSLRLVHAVAAGLWMGPSHSRRVHAHVWKFSEDSCHRRLELLSLSLFLLMWLSLYGQPGLPYMMEKPFCASAYPFSACITLATLSMDKVSVGRTYRRV